MMSPMIDHRGRALPLDRRAMPRRPSIFEEASAERRHAVAYFIDEEEDAHAHLFRGSAWGLRTFHEEDDRALAGSRS